MPDSTNHPLRYLFIDFNSYFASVEQNDDPHLTGRPVMVIPIDSEHSGAIAVSIEAKKIGIKRGTSVREARKMFPDIIIRSARHDRYVEMHNLLMAEIDRHIPITRIFSIDECVCRLNPDEQDVGHACALALRIKRGIALNIGPCLRASIGIAPSPLLAKLASDLKKPDGLTVIESAMLPDALLDLPINAISGIGANMEKRLMRVGVDNFAGLWKLAPKHARAIWGSVAGERFCYALHGHDILEEAPAEKRMIGHSRVLSREDQSLPRARIVARALLLKAASRLRLYDLYASRMTLGLKLRSGAWSEQWAVLSPATQNSWNLLRKFDLAWDQAIDNHRKLLPDQPERLVLVTVNLHNLSIRPPEPDLFACPRLINREELETKLWYLVDKINRNHGKTAIQIASHHGLDLNYLGLKIAFSRVPDIREFGS